jgi:Na+/H+ antiporter NhaD/arsenite permease-like protein
MNIFIVKPVTLKLFANFNLTLDYGTAPPLGVILLLVTTSIGSEELIRGILGSDTQQPYSIFILFFTLAYICISLDLTGVFEWIAGRVAQRAQSSASNVRLFIYFTLLSAVLTLFTSNDIVILTLTPTLISYCNMKGLDPEPYLMSCFIAANCWSAALYIGNPTNIIVADAFRLTFTEYSEWMMLPAVVTGMMAMLTTLLVYRRQILTQATADCRVGSPVRLKKPTEALFGMSCLLLCLITLIITSFYAIPVWMVTLPFAVLVLCKDIIMDCRLLIGKQNPTLDNKPFHRESQELQALGSTGPEAGESKTVRIVNESRPENSYILPQAISRMPWKIGPFVIAMFILVEALDSTGWVNLMGRGLQPLASADRSPLFVTVVFTGITSAACILLNNQPMSILFTKAMFQRAFLCKVPSKNLQSAMYSLIQGSNYGANFGLSAALAGLMWIRILNDKQVYSITYWRFMKLGTAICMPAILGAALVLGAEIIIRSTGDS